MANASYDVLTIQINADSKEANKSIKGLSNNLNKLNESAKNLDTRRLGEVKGLLLNIAKIDFSNVSKGLQDVVSAFKYFQSKTAQKISPIYSIKDLNKEMASYTSMMKNADFSIAGADKLVDASEVKKGTEAIVEATKQTQELGKELDNLKKKSHSALSQFAKMFKNILKYRVVRKLIQTIFQEIVSAIQELASVDSDFNQSLGEIKSAISYVARVLVSIIAPVVKVLAPIITAIADGIGMIGSAFSDVFSGSLGQEEFAEAQENVESYTDSIKKAKSQMAGIDELNVFSQEESGNFEMKATTDKNSALTQAISKLIETLKPVFSAIKDVVVKLRPILNFIVELLSFIIDETSEGVSEMLQAVINAIGTIIEFIGKLLEALRPLIKFIVSLINILANFINKAITNVANLLSNILKGLMPVIQLIGGLLEKIAPVLNLIVDLLQTITGQTDDPYKRLGVGILSLGGSEIIRFLTNGLNLGGGSFASGGFPEDGLFMANHGELVGSFSNGKTAVANNQQITTGIYEAVLQAMRESGGNNKGIVVNLDGYQVAKIITNRQDNFGKSLIVGDKLSFGK